MDCVICCENKESVRCASCGKAGCSPCYVEFLMRGDARVGCMFCVAEWDRARIAQPDMRWYLPEFNARVGRPYVIYEQGLLMSSVVGAKLMCAARELGPFENLAVYQHIPRYGSTIYSTLVELHMLYHLLQDLYEICRCDDGIFLRYVGDIFDGSEEKLLLRMQCRREFVGTVCRGALDKVYTHMSHPHLWKRLFEPTVRDSSFYAGWLSKQIRARQPAAISERAQHDAARATAAGGGSVVVQPQPSVARKCVRDGCSGILDGSLVCNACFEILCDQCLCMYARSDTHVCDASLVKSVSAARGMGRACPRCGMQIVLTAGCDDMFCVMCHVGFSYRTGIISNVRRHNPHRTEWEQTLARQQAQTASAGRTGVETRATAAAAAPCDVQALEPLDWLLLDRFARRRTDWLTLMCNIVQESPAAFRLEPNFVHMDRRAHRITLAREYQEYFVDRNERGLMSNIRFRRVLGEIMDAEFATEIGARVLAIEQNHLYADVFDGIAEAAMGILRECCSLYREMPAVLRSRHTMEACARTRGELMIVFFHNIFRDIQHAYGETVYGLRVREGCIETVLIESMIVY